MLAQYPLTTYMASHILVRALVTVDIKTTILGHVTSGVQVEVMICTL